MTTPSPKSPPKPSIGRIVHFILSAAHTKALPGHHRAAIITKVHSDTLVNLRVFADVGDGMPEAIFSEASVEFDDADHKAAHTWHWPEREA